MSLQRVSSGWQWLPMMVFLGLGIIWGSNFVYMKMATHWLSSSQIVLLRILFGFLLVALYVLYRKELRWWHLRYFHHFLVMSVLAASFYYLCFVEGSRLLPSGIAGALSGAIPLFTFLLAMIFVPNTPLNWQTIGGLITGLVGVVLIADPFSATLEAAAVQGVLFIMLGSLSLGASFVYANVFITPLKIPATALVAYQLGIALFTLVFIVDMDGAGELFEHLHASLGVIIGLGLLGTGVAYLAYYHLVAVIGPTSAASVTYIPPVIALLIGVVLLGESIRGVDYAATVLILFGVFALNRRVE